MKVRALGVLAIATALFAPIPSGAQQKQDGVTSDECKKSPGGPGITELVNEPIRGVPGKCIRITQIVLGPNGDTGPHLHPGDEYGIVVEGPLMLQRGCAAYQPAGNNFSVPRGPSMNVWNEADKPAMLISILIIDAGKEPLTRVEKCRD